MIKLRDNRGLTLIELITAIAIGSIITLAATTILLLGLRIYKQSNDDITRQNQVRVGMTVMEELIAEGPVLKFEETADYIPTTDETSLLRLENGSIITSAGAQIMENVTEFEAKLVDNLLTFKVIVGGEEYTSSVYCRIVEEPAPIDGAVAYAANRDSTLDLDALLCDGSLSLNVRAFLKTLVSQMGSTGRILTEDGEAEYYSEWYIGSYEDHPGWNEDTPWCACFVSWALEECSGYLQGQTPRFANVDTFWAEFVTSDQWKTAEPEAGDIVFFDWLVDDERNPQHVGVVLAESKGWLYTIEGNSVGTVAIRRYPADDDRILAYGTLNWA